MEPERIDLGEFAEEYAGGWVEVRARLSFRRRQTVDNHRQGRVVRDPVNGEIREAGVDFLAFGIALLTESVLRWEGVNDRQGKALPANRAGFEHEDFEDELGDWLVDRIESIHRANKRAPAERKVEASASSES